MKKKLFTILSILLALVVLIAFTMTDSFSLDYIIRSVDDLHEKLRFGGVLEMEGNQTGCSTSSTYILNTGKYKGEINVASGRWTYLSMDGRTISDTQDLNKDPSINYPIFCISNGTVFELGGDPAGILKSGNSNVLIVVSKGSKFIIYKNTKLIGKNGTVYTKERLAKGHFLHRKSRRQGYIFRVHIRVLL